MAEPTASPPPPRRCAWARPCLAMLAVAALLGGCASGPRSAADPAPAAAPAIVRDGPDPNPPPGLEQVPDAEPKVEPLRLGGPNKPYVVLGQAYTPVAADRPLSETGLASWYGRKFHGRPTANGEIYDMHAMTAAHKTMPLPSYARVRNVANGKEVVVRVNDRGPFHAGRVIDLSYTAALKLGVLSGVAKVEVERLTHDDIRAGLWRRDGSPAAPAAPLAPAGEAPDPLLALLTAPAATAYDIPATPEPVPAATPPVPGRFWLQLGAFSQRDNATALHREVQRDADWLSPLLAVFAERSTYRVQAGPFASRAEAQGVADRLKAVLRSLPRVTERR